MTATVLWDWFLEEMGRLELRSTMEEKVPRVIASDLKLGVDGE